MSILRWKQKVMCADGGVLRDSGGGSSSPTQSTSYNTNIPEYARPYVENMLQSTQAQIYNDDMTSFRPYTPYSNDTSKYFADFTPMQKYAQSETANMQTPGQYGAATGLAGAAGVGGLSAGDQASYLGNQALGYGAAGQMYGDVGQMYGAQGAQNAQSAAQMAQMQAQRLGQSAVRTGNQALGYGAQGAGYGQGAVGMGQNAANMAAQQGLGYGAQGAGYGQAAAGLAGQATSAGQNMADIGSQGLGYGALGTGYGAQAAQQAQQGYGAGANYAAQATNPNATAAYMSPYMQNVVDYQKSQALRDYGIGQGMRQAGAVSKGAFGGSRQAIENAEAQRNLNSQLQGIEATGAQQAFQNAQGQQQFGANLGLQGLQAGYQGTGMGIQGAQTGLQGLGTAMQGQQGALAGLGQAGSLYGQGMQGAQTGLQGLQGALAGSAQGLQGYQTGMQGAQTGMQGVSGALAGYNTGLSGVSQQLGAGQLGLQGTAQGIQGSQAGMQGAGYGLQGVQGATGAGQYGLQGYGLANTAAGQLSNIGSQQQASDLARLQAQQQAGAQQQTYKQNLINQDISNYATQQQYPFMQLGIMNSMLRGLPLQQTTTASYQQQPSTAQQLTGLAGAGLSYLGKKEGGIIGMKEGGTVPGFKYGDLISGPKLQGMSQNLSPEQNQARIADPQVTPDERGIFQGTQQAQQRMASNPMAAQQMAQAAPPPQMAQPPSDVARMGGIAAAGGDMFNTMGYAGGGIIAFADGDLVDEQRLQAEKDAAAQDVAPKAKTKTAANTREGMLAQTQAMLQQQGFDPGATPEEKANAALIAKRQASSGDVTSAQERANNARFWLEMGSNPRGILPGAIEGGKSWLTGAGEIAAKAETREMALSDAAAKHAAGMRARAVGDITSSDKLFHEAAQLENQAKIAAGNNAATLGAAQIHADASGKPQAQEEAKVDAYMKDHPTASRSEAYAAVAQYSRGETTELNRIRYADAVLADDPEYLKYKNSKKPEDQAKLAEIRRKVYERYGVTQPSTTAAAPVPVQNQDGTITIPGKGTFRAVDGGYQKVG